MVVDGSQRLDVYQRTRRSMLLLELGLVRLEHADLAPPIEEQHDGTRPQDEHETDNDHLFRAHDDPWAVWRILSFICRI